MLDAKLQKYEVRPKKYPTLSPPAKNNATSAKWFWRIVTSQLLHGNKDFKPIVGVILFF